MTIVVTSSDPVIDYTWLSDTVASWLHRTDLGPQIPDFIALAEDELNTELRLRTMEVDETLTLLQGENTVALPSRYLEPVMLDIVFTGDRDNERLIYQNQEQLATFDSTTVAQEPEFWSINGSFIEFPEPADQDYTLRFRMLKRLDISTDLTNYLLTNYRGLYLYGALLQATAYIVNDGRIPTWARMYANLLKKVRDRESRTNIRANLQTDVMLQRRRSNIYKGY